MNDEEFDVENMSDLEFAQAMRELGSRLGDDKPVKPRTPIDGMHWTADRVNITEDTRMTFGTYGGVAFVDCNGSVVVSQLGRVERCFCGHDHELDLTDMLGLAIVVNGERAFIPFKVLTKIIARAQSRYEGIEDVPPDQETWDL